MIDPTQTPFGSYPVPQLKPPGGLFWTPNQPALPSGLAGQGLFGSGLVPPPPVANSAMGPNNPTPPNLPQNQPSDLPSDTGGDFLQTVRQVGGGILSGALNVIDFPAKVIARPGFELLTEPQVFVDKVNEGDGDIWKTINLLTEAFEENKAPGVVKFLGQAALDPLTYLSAGTLTAISKAKYIAPLIRTVPGGTPAIGAAISGLQHYEKAVDATFTGVGQAVQGLATNYIPLQVAKTNAAAVLSKVLPDGLVRNIVDSIPNQYDGIPIGALSNALNKTIPNLGLPLILKAPDVRLLKQQMAFNGTWDAAHMALASRGINIHEPITVGLDYAKTLNDIVQRPQLRVLNGVEDRSDLITAAVIRRPTVFNKTDIGRVNNEVGGIMTRGIPTDGHVLHINEVLNSYHTGVINEGDTVQALSQFFGISAKNNPEAGDTLRRLLRGRDIQQREYINELSKMSPADMVGSIAGRAKNIANKEFDLKIAQERAANTYMDQFLNGFDNVYTNVYKNTALRFVIQPVSMLYLGFLGYPIGNAVESYGRHLVGGGGFDLPIHTSNFNIENGLLDAPRELFAEQSRQSFVAAEIVARGKGTPLDYPVQWVKDLIIDPGSKIEQAMWRHYWNNAVAQELDHVYFAKGLGARTDFSDWIEATRTIDVGSDPQFAGLSQKIADSISRAAVKAVSGGTNAIQSLKNTIDTGFFNRQKLANDLLDNEDFATLHPSSRAIMGQWAQRGENSAAGASAMIDRVMDNEKQLVEIMPEVLAEKFKGLSDKIIQRSSQPNFAAADLFQSVNDLRALREQYASIPEMLRMREYETLQRNQIAGRDIASIHDEFALKLKRSMDEIDKVIQPSFTFLIGQANRLGLGPQVTKYVNLLRNQQDLLAANWAEDAAFREEFFAAKPNRRLQSTWDDPVEGYFPRRRNLWELYAGQHAILSQEATSARLELETAINTQKEFKQIADANLAKLANEKSDADVIEQGITEGRSVEEIAAGITDTPQIKPGGIAEQVAALDARNATDDEYRQVLSTGSRSLDKYPDWKTKAHAYGDIETRDYTPTVDAGISAEESTAGAGGNIGVTENIGQGQNGGHSITGNGPSADSAGNVPSSTFAVDHLRAVDSLRPRIEARLQQAFATPAMTEPQKKLLTDYVDKIHATYESMDQSKQTILNESMREAVIRAKERYYNAYINYDDQTVFDFVAKHVFPFWVYESRRWPYLANVATKFPGLASAYNNYMDRTDNGYVNIGEMPYDVNPLRGTVLGGIKRAVDKDQPMRHTDGLQGALESIETTLGKFGFYMGPHISIPSQIIRGEAGQTLPEIFSSTINLGRAAGLPGFAGTEELLPDPFRDYYVRQILATQGLEPDKVYQRAADDPNGIEAQALDVAQRQAGIVGVVLGQTGVLRFRTNEYSSFLDTKMAAIESITGISVVKQKEMRAQGISINNVTSLTPAQRQELAALPGTVAFQEIAEPLLNPVAQKLRKAQREFFDAVKDERARVTGEQNADDERLASAIISGAEWRKRYQDRSGRVSNMVSDLKRSEAYKSVPISTDEQIAARKRFNLPALTQSPVDIVLQEYYGVKPETDAVTDEVNWSKFFTDRQAVLLKYPAVYQAVKTEIEKNDTPQVRDFKAAMELLRPYFGIKDQIMQQYPQFAQEVSYVQYLQNTNPVEAALYKQNSSTLKILNKIVGNTQYAARAQFPQLDAALVKYYGATPMIVQMMGKQGGLFNTGSSGGSAIQSAAAAAYH